MRSCALCKKKFANGMGNLFNVPKDPVERAKWSEICGRNFASSNTICADHFPERSIARTGKIVRLLTNAKPSAKRLVEFNETTGSHACVETDLSTPHMVTTKYRLQKEGNPKNSYKVVMPPQLEEELVMEMPAIPPELQEEYISEGPVSKSLFRTGSTQTNTGLCGLVDILSDEFRLNCFYCFEVFPLEKWKVFANHLREKHFDTEEVIKECEYVTEDDECSSINSKDHDYTSIDLNPSCRTDNAVETATINSKAELPLIVDPLESTDLNFSPKTLDTSEEELEVEQQNEPDTVEVEEQIPTEIAFEYTPREIVDFLLDSMKKYPVLWQFDDQPFNDDFYEAVEDLCTIINEKYSLNIDNLKMRRSINRILRFYCYLYPNDNVEHIDQFTHYYDKCASFLPASVNEIAYARCTHCYMCYKCDFDLKPHLLEEHKYLQWPYKCVQCKECFLQSDEYEFHKYLPHYDENFRCEPCNKTFFRRNMYTKHVLEKHTGDAEAEYKCDICEKVFRHRTNLRDHKLTHGEKNHKCHLCPKSYINITRLRLHLKRHRRQYDFMCELCGHKLFSISSLKVHMKKHTKEKITCNICNLKLRKSSLNRHLQLLHVAYEGTIEQTLKGRHVNYRRLVKSSPFRQRRKNSDKNYDCKICKMSFENYELVIEHNMEFHPDIPKWSCQICVMDFSLKKNLKRHYRRRHKLEPIQVLKLVEENEDLNVVLAYDKEDLDNLAKANSNKSKQANVKKSSKISMKSDLLEDEIYFAEENNVSSELQDEIMNSADTIEETDDYIIEYLEDECSNL